MAQDMFSNHELLPLFLSLTLCSFLPNILNHFDLMQVYAWHRKMFFLKKKEKDMQFLQMEGMERAGERERERERESVTERKVMTFVPSRSPLSFLPFRVKFSFLSKILPAFTFDPIQLQ